MHGLLPCGLSHSEIRGSEAICASPRLIAAYHVLHRLREPRHPSCALLYFLVAFAALKKKEPRNVAHTFSCLVYRSHRQCRPKGHDLGLSPTEMNIVDCSFYSFACVNMSKIFCQGRRHLCRRTKRVENNGFEPLTPCLQSRCSSQLS